MSMVFALVLLGCADDGQACEKLAAPTQHYITKAQCEAGQDIALQSEAALRADYPIVVSRCQRLSGGTAFASDRQRPMR